MFDGFIILLRLLLAASVIGKAYLHFHVAYRSGIRMGAGGGLPIETLWYITKPVERAYERKKKICNNLQTFNITLLIALILISFFE
jgi:hypothetical protein